MENERNEKMVKVENEMKIWVTCDLATGKAKTGHGIEPPQNCEQAIPFPINIEKIPAHWFSEGVKIFSKIGYTWRIYVSNVPKKGIKFIIADSTGESREITHCHFLHAVFYENYDSHNCGIEVFENKFAEFCLEYDKFYELRDFLVSYGFVTRDQNKEINKVGKWLYDFRKNSMSFNIHATRLHLSLFNLRKAASNLNEINQMLGKYSRIRPKDIKLIQDCFDKGDKVPGRAKRNENFSFAESERYLKEVKEKCDDAFASITLGRVLPDNDMKQLKFYLKGRIIDITTYNLDKHLIDKLTANRAVIKERYDLD